MDDDILQKNICCEFLALLMQTQHVCSWLGMQGFMGLEFLQRHINTPILPNGCTTILTPT